MMRAACIVALVVISVIPTSPAFAQESTLASQAREAFQAHDYPRALRLLQQLHAQSPSPRILFNEATCLARLARHREASVVLEELLAWPDLGAIFSEEQQRAAREALEESRARLIPLHIVGAAGTTARVDGEIECTVPCELALDEGSHSVAHEGQVHSVDLVPGDEARLTVQAPELALLDDAAPRSSRLQPSALTWIGAGLTALGTAGVIGFGLYSNDLSAQFEAAGPRAPESLADEGRTATAMANVSLAVAGVGLVLVLIDLLILREID